MRLGGAVETVQRFGSNIDCRVKPKRLVGAVNIVVDGLGYADDRDAPLVQARGDAESIVAADGHERGEIHALDMLDDRLKLLVGRIGARGAEDRAAEMQDARHALAGEREIVALEYAGPTVAET